MLPFVLAAGLAISVVAGAAWPLALLYFVRASRAAHADEGEAL